MLEIQRFLKSHKDIEFANDMLERNLGIIIKKKRIEHAGLTMGYVYTYNYSKRKSLLGHPIVNECNCLLLDRDANVVCKGLPITYNWVEPHKAEINWDNAFIQPKEKGKMVVVYRYKGLYFIATKHSAMGDEYASNTASMIMFSVRSKVLTLLQANRSDSLERHFDAASSFVFQLTNSEELVLLGIINNQSGMQIPMEVVDAYARGHNFKRPARLKVNSTHAAIHYLDDIGKQAIVCDTDCNRVVVYNKDELHPRKRYSEVVPVKALAEVVLAGDGTVYSRYFPMYREIINLFTNTIGVANCKLEQMLVRHDKDDLEDLKITLENSPAKWILLDIKRGNVASVRHALNKLNPELLLQLVVYYFPNVYNKLYKTAKEMTHNA